MQVIRQINVITRGNNATNEAAKQTAVVHAQLPMMAEEGQIAEVLDDGEMMIEWQT